MQREMQLSIDHTSELHGRGHYAGGESGVKVEKEALSHVKETHFRGVKEKVDGPLKILLTLPITFCTMLLLKQSK
jgi:hypothetical protein